MAYLVKITARAQRDLALLYGEINAEHSDAALKWYRNLEEAILSLEHQPNRCPVTPESAMFRHMRYGNKPHIYRVIYRVVKSRSKSRCSTFGTAQGGGSRPPTSPERGT